MKYQRSTTLDCKGIGMDKFEFVAKTHFLKETFLLYCEFLNFLQYFFLFNFLIFYFFLQHQSSLFRFKGLTSVLQISKVYKNVLFKVYIFSCVFWYGKVWWTINTAIVQCAQTHFTYSQVYDKTAVKQH